MDVLLRLKKAVRELDEAENSLASVQGRVSDQPDIELCKTAIDEARTQVKRAIRDLRTAA
jgi:hypothetical protein